MLLIFNATNTDIYCTTTAAAVTTVSASTVIDADNEDGNTV